MELLQPVIRRTPGARGTASPSFRAAPSRPRARRPSCGWAPTRPPPPAWPADHPGRRHRRRPGPRARPGCVARFGPRLPFLLKVLSADRALSIQVHPSRAQAEAGLPRRERARPAPGDPARNYVDDWPKPELLCALTPFEVLAGLRSPPDAAALLRALAVAPLAAPGRRTGRRDRPRRPSAAPWPPSSNWPRGLPRDLVTAVVAACADRWPAPVTAPTPRACAAAVRVAGDHPGDLGVVAMLLLRHAVLAPGPGGVHAGRRPARLPARHRHRGAGQLRQRGPGRPDRQARRRPRAAQAARPGRHRPRPDARPPSATASPGSTPRPRSSASTWPTWPSPRSPCPPPAPGSRCAPTAPRPCAPATGEPVKLARGESCFISAADGPLHAYGPARLSCPPAPGSSPRPGAPPGRIGLSLMPSAGELGCVSEVSDTAT